MNKQNQKQTRITGALRRLLFAGLPIFALFIAPLVSLVATSPVYAAGETYTWASSTTIQATGGSLPSATTFTVSGNTAAATIELPQSGEDFCKPTLRLTISSDRKSATLAVFVTPSAGNPGDPGQNCSDAESVIDGWQDSTVQIGGDQGAESEAQMEVDVVLYNQYYKDDPKSAPKRVTFSIKSASGATASFKSNIAKDGNYYGTFYKVAEGTWTYCVDKIDTKCQTKTKIKYQPSSVAFGEFSKGAIRVELDVNPRLDDPNAKQTVGPLTIELRDKDDKVLDTKDVTLEYPGCDPDRACGGAIHLYKTFDFENVKPGNYKVCYGETCKNVTKEQRTMPTVKLAISQANIDEVGTGGDEESETTCAVDGVGWIVCPVMTFLAKLNDSAFGFLNNLLGIRPALFTDKGTLAAWSAFRDIANVAFVVAFLVIVYSQVTGMGVSNYGVKKLLPRIFVAALLVNLSYWICAVATDLSNIIGSSSYSLLKDSIDVSVAGGGGGAGSETWSNVMAGVLAVAAGVLLVAVVIMAPTVLLALALILMILIARQALVIMLIVISPLAFVAYLLPNTEDWFKKWRKAFTVTLMVYPIVGVIFGASTLASNILMNVAQDGTGGGDDEQLLKIVALSVLAVPLFAVPVVLKGSLSAAGAIGSKIAALSDRTNRMAGKDVGKFAQAAGNLAKERALAGGGVFGAGGLIRGRARRNHMYDALERRGKAAEASFINTDGTASRREQRAIGAEETARLNTDINRDVAKKQHLADNHSLHTRATTAGLDLHNDEEIHKDEATADYIAANPTQYNSLYDAQGKLKEEQDKSKTNYNRTAAGNATGQRLKASGEDLSQSENEINRDYKRSAVGQAQAQTRQVIEGDIENADKDAKRAYKISTDGQAQAQTGKVLDKEIGIADKATELVYAESAAGRAQAQREQAVQGDLEIAHSEDVADFKQSDVAVEQAISKDAVKQREAIADSFAGTAATAVNRRVRVEAQAAKDALTAAEAGEAALVQELRTEAGAEANPGYEDVARDLSAADIEKRVQTQRTGAANRKADVEYAHAVRDESSGLATTAGGIEGAAGVSQAKAVAKQTIIDAFKKGVAAEATLFSDVKEDQMLGDPDANGNILPGNLSDPDILDQPDEKISAMGSVIAKRQHMKSHIRLWERMGELQKQVQAEEATASAIADPDAREAALARVQERKDKLVNLQQQVMADKSKKPFGIGDEAQGKATVGEYDEDIYESTRARILTHLSPEALASMDPDDLSMIYELGRQGKLGPEHTAKIKEAYQAWKDSDILKDKLKDKARVLLEPFARDDLASGPDSAKYPAIADMPNP
ncbi:MAG TPA: hypothetical protein PK096_01385 [Candidatus Saccharibacteria bacterium]|nr:hypothetical protein [Candidatus Saccharibacteria bacterium]HRK94002.1 hypothetical protein [Candidatus Saccharibacteria bacterium]